MNFLELVLKCGLKTYIMDVYNHLMFLIINFKFWDVISFGFWFQTDIFLFETIISLHFCYFFLLEMTENGVFLLKSQFKSKFTTNCRPKSVKHGEMTNPINEPCGSNTFAIQYVSLVTLRFEKIGPLWINLFLKYSKSWYATYNSLRYLNGGWK